VNPQSGQVRLVTRRGGAEPGFNPRSEEFAHDRDPEPGAPQSGFVFTATFDGSAWSTPQRAGVGRLPGPSGATPLFTAPVAPRSLFDTNTARFHDFLIGEDAQVYHSPAAP
jgi:hypothetical protein